MENKIVIVTFYAFARKTQKAYVDKTDLQIEEDLNRICATNHILSIETYKATLTDKKIINDEDMVIGSQTKGESEEES